MKDSLQEKQFVRKKKLIKEESDMRKERSKEMFHTLTATAGSLFTNVTQNPSLLFKMSAILMTLYGSVQLTRLSVQMLGNKMMSNYKKPQLVRETSKITAKSYFSIPLIQMRKFYSNYLVKRTEADLLKGIILDKKLEEQLREISYAILNRRKHYAPAKNMLFYGPPGTGKTLFAKKLATESGMEYAVMVGSDIAPLGAGAVTELNKLFDWAEYQSNGIILFIDEADAFLRSRNEKMITEYLRHSVNTFLYRTGTPSDKVVVILATNNPDQIDEAVHDRIDEVVGFKLPNENERRLMLFHYLVKFCQPPQSQAEKLQFLYNHPKSLVFGKKLIRTEGITKEVVNQIALQTEGFSGREITKMVVAWHDAAFSLPDPVITPELMNKILKKFHLQHKLKDTWTHSDQQILSKIMFFDDEKDFQGEKDQSQAAHKSQEMLLKEEELMASISQERLDMRNLNAQEEEALEQEAAPEDVKETASKMKKQMKQK
mmetsp:Transcript_2832/g.4836  ORF Transcript_2832/g.4836 Transcript_2832/m.4836 type:complete len:487 (-) Transcript_2832:44-1504(-)